MRARGWCLALFEPTQGDGADGAGHGAALPQRHDACDGPREAQRVQGIGHGADVESAQALGDVHGQRHLPKAMPQPVPAGERYPGT